MIESNGMLTDFTSLIRSAAREAFQKIREDHRGEGFCAFALYSDEGAMTVCAAANTQSHLEARLREEPDEALYWKWSPAEWKHEGFGDGCFVGVHKALQEFHARPHDDAQFLAFQQGLFESCVAAMEALRIEGALGDGIAVFCVTDHQDAAQEIAWVRRLNARDHANEFQRWINSQQ